MLPFYRWCTTIARQASTVVVRSCIHVDRIICFRVWQLLTTVKPQRNRNHLLAVLSRANGGLLLPRRCKRNHVRLSARLRHWSVKWRLRYSPKWDELVSGSNMAARITAMLVKRATGQNYSTNLSMVLLLTFWALQHRLAVKAQCRNIKYATVDISLPYILSPECV